MALTLVGGLAMTVAIAIGAIAFEVISVLLDPALPFPDGQRVVAVKYVATKAGRSADRVLHVFSTWRDRVTTLEHVGAFRDAQHNLVAPNTPPQPIHVAEITAIVNRSFASDVLGVAAHAALGSRFRYTTRTDWFEIVGVVDDFLRHRGCGAGFRTVRKIWQAFHAAICMMSVPDLDVQGLLNRNRSCPYVPGGDSSPQMVQPVVSTSAPPRGLDGGDVDLLHRHHRFEGTLCLTATSRKRLG